jgi:hypothetical protein
MERINILGAWKIQMKQKLATNWTTFLGQSFYILQNRLSQSVTTLGQSNLAMEFNTEKIPLNESG